MNSRDKAHQETEDAARDAERNPWIFVAIAVAIIIGSSAGVYDVVNANSTSQVRKLEEQNKTLAAKAQAAADAAAQQARANCQLDKLVAEAPLSTPTSQFAINAALGARVAYSIAQCDLNPNLGRLTAPDPRVAVLLPPGVS